MPWVEPIDQVAGTVAEAAYAQSLKAALLINHVSIDDLGNLSPVIETNGATTQQDNLAIGTTTGTLVFTGATALDLTGVVAPAQEGKLLSVIAQGAGTVTLKDESASSTAANRFDLGGSDVEIATDQAVLLVYENAKWRAISTPAGASPLAAYVPTVQDVGPSSTALTTIITVDIPAGEWLDGERIRGTGWAKLKNDSAGAATFSPAMTVGGVASAQALTNVAQNKSAVEQEIPIGFVIWRQGADVYLMDFNGSQGTLPQHGPEFWVPWQWNAWAAGSFVNKWAAVNFAATVTIAIKMQLSVSDATTYFKMGSFSVHKFGA